MLRVTQVLSAAWYVSHSVALICPNKSVHADERELMRGAGPVAVLRLLESGEK
jgi:hypothetical protein